MARAQRGWRSWPAALLLALLCWAVPHLAAAQPQTPSAATASPPAAGPPAEVEELLRLLARPTVRAWLDGQQALASAPADAATATAVPVPVPVPATAADASMADLAAGRLTRIKAHMAGLAAAVPGLPDDFLRAATELRAELHDRGILGAILLIAGFVALGAGANWLVFQLLKGPGRFVLDNPMVTVRDRITVVLARLGWSLVMALAFAVGSVGAFVLLDWPPRLRAIVLSYLVAFLALRLSRVIGRFLLAPGIGAKGSVERFRVVPMDRPAAVWWYHRLNWAVGWFAIGYATVTVLRPLGFQPAALQLVAYVLGFGLLLIGLHVAWRHPPLHGGAARPAGWPPRGRAVVWSVIFGAIWASWVVGASNLLWLLIVGAAYVWLNRVTSSAVGHLLRPAGAPDQAPGDGDADPAPVGPADEGTALVGPAGFEPPSIAVVCLEKGLRAALVMGAAATLAWAWQLDLGSMMAEETMATRLLRGALSALVIVLVADFLWSLMRTVIDRRLAGAQFSESASIEDERRRSRLRTLLPVLRNVVYVMLLVMTVLMALSALGIQIAPLIAGAGVVGVAIGFGSQTLVRDVISGVFYLLDDAFRVGEYIQSGTYKGTVESFSLRSIKLRHHRGPLFTVPFGMLGAVQNMSRDWVIDKMSISVTFDTDLDQVKKIIKQIGKELAANEEFAPDIIETLKMQGVETFSDFAIEVRMKMMTRPGKQFTIRRRAYALIKKAFAANGIKFALPTVTVAGGEAEPAAVARQALELTKPAPAAA